MMDIDKAIAIVRETEEEKEVVPNLVGLHRLDHLVPLLQLLLPAHPQGLGGDFLEVPYALRL